MSEASTIEQVKEVVNEELSKPETATVGGKQVAVKALKRRWQALFYRAVYPFLRPQMAATEEIQKSVADGTSSFKNMTELILNAELESDAALDEAAAIILAHQVVGSEADTAKAIEREREWLADNSTTNEMRDLVYRQIAKERIIEDVGERWPARLAMSLRLAGDPNATADSVRLLLTNSSSKLPATSTTDGNLTKQNAGG